MSIIQITDDILIKMYVRHKLNQKFNNCYSPDNNNIKYLVIMACHCDSEIKLSTIKKNLTYFDFNSVNVLLLMSENLPYNLEINNYCSTYKNVQYKEAPNESTYDFGKWIYGLKTIDYNKYNFIIFTNDSYIIHAPINHFLNLTFKYNLDFYGYNDSTQDRYHYQSYLFSLKRDVIPIFIQNYISKKNMIKNQADVITHYELTMTDWFNNRKSYLKIGNIQSHKTKNIFFTNDSLYKLLKETTLLPFTKIKRLT